MRWVPAVPVPHMAVSSVYAGFHHFHGSILMGAIAGHDFLHVLALLSVRFDCGPWIAKSRDSQFAQSALNFIPAAVMAAILHVPRIGTCSSFGRSSAKIALQHSPPALPLTVVTSPAPSHLQPFGPTPYFTEMEYRGGIVAIGASTTHNSLRDDDGDGDIIAFTLRVSLELDR